MSRHKRKRRVAALPHTTALSTYGGGSAHLEALTVEEYEAVRLIDYVGLTQSEAAEKMEVARTTVQAIYCKARFKLARLMVEGGLMKIEGGEYYISPESEQPLRTDSRSRNES